MPSSSQVRERNSRWTDEQRAVAALRWSLGETQSVIGIDLGLKPSGAAPCVSNAIQQFLAKYLPPELAKIRDGSDRSLPWYAIGRVTAQAEGRKALVAVALRNYHAQTGVRLRVKLRASKHVGK